jgi:hypothetical protein
MHIPVVHRVIHRLNIDTAMHSKWRHEHIRSVSAVDHVQTHIAVAALLQLQHETDCLFLSRKNSCYKNYWPLIFFYLITDPISPGWYLLERTRYVFFTICDDWTIANRAIYEISTATLRQMSTDDAVLSKLAWSGA